MFIVFILSFKTFVSSVYLSISLEHHEFAISVTGCGFSVPGRPLVSSMNEKDWFSLSPVCETGSMCLVLMANPIIIRAGRYDQKFISRYFSKLYRFHGI